jgi:ABC-2 type transport system ATP-binding protein
MTDAITIEHVSKRFRINHERADSLKSAILGFGRRHSYEDFLALDDVSLRVPAGGTYGLLGANGSGKSTLLKIVSRIHVPDTGRVAVQGRLAALLELGTGFHPELSGRENVFLNASILGLRRKDVAARFDDIVDFAELGRFIDNPIKTYSSGMIVRLGFSVATSLDPEVLLIDEVLAVGDTNFRKRSRERMEQLLSSGCSILLVTHDLNTARSLCSEAASLDAGRIRMRGDVDEVIADYQEMMRQRAEAADATGEQEERKVSKGAILALRLLGADGEPLEELAHGQSMTLELAVDSGRCPPNTVLTLGLAGGDGMLLSHVQSKDALADLPPSGPVTVQVRLGSDALANGKYSWSVALRDGDNLDLVDRIDNGVTFVVHHADPWSRGYVNMPISVVRTDAPVSQAV